VAAKSAHIAPPSQKPSRLARFGPAGVEDRAEIVHALLERRHLSGRHAVGEARAALVEEDEAAEARQAAKHRRIFRPLPLVLEVPDEPGHDDEVERALTHGLIGDVEIAALRVVRLDIRHPREHISASARGVAIAVTGNGRPRRPSSPAVRDRR
jgi:hypothetical protein